MPWPAELTSNALPARAKISGRLLTASSIELNVDGYWRYRGAIRHKGVVEWQCGDHALHWSSLEARNCAAVELDRRVKAARPRTKTGRVLTDAEIEALADEAEAGYDVSHLANRPNRRRPRPD